MQFLLQVLDYITGIITITLVIYAPFEYSNIMWNVENHNTSDKVIYLYSLVL